MAEQEAALSPTVLRKDGYRLYFFSREEPRVHVHAYCGDGEAKFWLEPQVELAYNHSLNRKQLREIEAIIDTTRRLSMPGATTSAIEVTNISKHGLWLFTQDGEHFLPFADFPWFRDAPVGHILNVEEPTPGHYYWPDLDVDLSLNIVRNPDRFPLTAKAK